MGTSTFWNPLGHPRPVMGLLYLLFHFICNISMPIKNSYIFYSSYCSRGILYYLHEENV
jgi:hypothetical protein